MSANGLHPVYAGTGHCVELIVEQEMAPVFAAFRMSGVVISHVRFSFCFFSSKFPKSRWLYIGPSNVFGRY